LTNDVQATGGGALARAQRVQAALAESVRRARQSSKRRKSYDTAVFSRRKGARVAAIAYALAFVLLFVFPIAIATVYFVFVASPQYQVEARFTVQGGEARKLDGIGVLTGLPSITIIQDTQIIANYIRSRAMVEELQERIDLRRIYGSRTIDWFARFDSEKPIERLLDYWKSVVDVSIQLPGGIVIVTIKAFSPEDALLVGRTVLELSEKLVNKTNQRMLKDNLDSAKLELERAAVRLGHARQALETARNAEGILDVGLASRALTDLTTGLKGDLLKLQQEYASQSRSVSKEAPQMRALESRIAAISLQIRDLEAKMTNLGSPRSANPSLSGSFTKFAELELERKIAEQHYGSTVAALEVARTIAERRLVYLQIFVHPSLPQASEYPRRTVSILVVAGIAFMTWAVLVGGITLARNHMA
jgi:capsular polysaccharide transport system permease protein